jgi:arylsulfatase A-like enzyme
MTLGSDLKLAPDSSPEDDTPAEAALRKQWEGMMARLTPEERRGFEAAYRAENDAFRKANPAGRDLAEWKYQRYIKDYLRCIAAVDESVGRVLDYLDRSGLADDTVVVYTSDQGFYLGEHGWFDKRFMYEESLRMPLLVRYPREISAGVNDKDMVLNLDFAPTFLDYAGAEPPAGMQGRSMRRVLRGRTPSDWRRSVYYHYFEYPAVHMVKRHYGVRTDRYKLIHFYYDIDAWELYDLKTDPREMRNIYDDPSQAGVVNNLKTELESLRARYGDSDEAKFLPVRRTTDPVRDDD